MKILIVNTSDIIGGAARAAYRLHRSLLAKGIDSQMLVQSKKSDDYTVLTLGTTKFKKALNLLRPTIDSIPTKFYKDKTQTLFSPAWFGFSDIIKVINQIDPDIVHLHWICGGMIKIEDIAKINAPIVWSLHDNWAFTGGCHIMWECSNYETQCGHCPRLGSKKENDLSRKVFSRKQKTFAKKSNMTIVGLSRWLNRASESSSLLRDKKHINLPNPIDTNIFKSIDRRIARDLWNLPQDKKLILFGAMSATSDINKGFKELTSALSQIQSDNVEFVVFGSSKPQNSPTMRFKTHYLGHLYDDISLVTLYSAVDVMVVPSLQEAFGQTVSESMACGTPVVAFGHTGILDIVEHQRTGYLATPFETKDLAYGIDWVLNNEDYGNLCHNARLKVIKEFDSNIVADKYIALYKDILDDKN